MVAISRGGRRPAPRQGTPDETQILTQLEWREEDFPIGHRIARALGYNQSAYTSTSDLWGLFCLPENPAFAKPGEATHGACIIKTRELGFLVVQLPEELGLDARGILRDRSRVLAGRR